MGGIILEYAIADGRIEIDLKATSRWQWRWQIGGIGVTSTGGRDHHLRKVVDDGLS